MIAFRSLKALVWALVFVSMLPAGLAAVLLSGYHKDAGLAGGILTFVAVFSALLDNVKLGGKPG